MSSKAEIDMATTKSSQVAMDEDNPQMYEELIKLAALIDDVTLSEIMSSVKIKR